VLDMNAEHIWMDQGIQTFNMILAPHFSQLQTSMMIRAAEELLGPPEIMYQGIHPGNLPKTGSFISLESPDVIVTAIKQAESNEDLIIRCVETSGRRSEAQLELKFANLKLKGSFGPFEIKTLRYSKKNNTLGVVTLLED